VKKKILTGFSYLLVAVLASAVTFGVVWWQGELSKLEQLKGLIDQCFIEEVDIREVEDAAADAMMKGTGGRWAYYIPQNEMAAHKETSENAYVGIGITITVAHDGDGLQIMSVNPGSSAEEAGLQADDVITAIEGQSASGMTTTEARNLVRGKEGTQVSITYRRGGQTHTVSVTRRMVQVAVATAQLLEENIGLITIANFDDRCANETIACIEELMAQGAESLIFDVRGNPGGYAHELVALLDYLLPEGELFRTVDYTGKESVDYSDADYLDIPMAVLVNGDSYSAAEFFAAALQEYEAAVIVGEKTTGKGYFQNLFYLTDGSGAAISTGKYFTPKGVSLEGVGIQPDVMVPVDGETAIKIYYGTLPRDEDSQLDAAVEALK